MIGKFKLWSTIVLSSLMFTCSSTPPVVSSGGNISEHLDGATKSIEEATKRVDDARVEIEKKTSGIEENTAKIDQELVSARSKNTSDQVENSLTQIDRLNDSIRKLASEIPTQTERIKDSVSRMRDNLTKLFRDVNEVKKFEAKINELANAESQSRVDAMKLLYQHFNWIAGLCFLVIVGGAVISGFVNMRLGLTVAAIGLICFVSAVGIVYYMKQVAIAGLVVLIGGLVVCFGLIAWSVFKAMKVKKTMAEDIADAESVITDTYNHVKESGLVQPEALATMFRGWIGATGSSGNNTTATPGVTGP